MMKWDVNKHSSIFSLASISFPLKNSISLEPINLICKKKKKEKGRKLLSGRHVCLHLERRQFKLNKWRHSSRLFWLGFHRQQDSAGDTTPSPGGCFSSTSRLLGPAASAPSSQASFSQVEASPAWLLIAGVILKRFGGNYGHVYEWVAWYKYLNYISPLNSDWWVNWKKLKESLQLHINILKQILNGTLIS